jgi:hypothetical protein
VIRLTSAGEALHERVLRVVQERERILHSAFSKTEIETLLDLLHRLHAQADIVNAYEPSDTDDRGRRNKPAARRRSSAPLSRRERSTRP